MQRVMSPLSTKGWNYGQRQLQICQFPPQCQSIQKKIHSCNLAVFYSILLTIFDMCENWTFFQSYKNKNISKEHCHSVVCLLRKVPTTRPIRGVKKKKKQQQQLHDCQATPTTSYTLNATSERNLCSQGSIKSFVCYIHA